jgi:hypothetical protein
VIEHRHPYRITEDEPAYDDEVLLVNQLYVTVGIVFWPKSYDYQMYYNVDRARSIKLLKTWVKEYKKEPKEQQRKKCMEMTNTILDNDRINPIKKKKRDNEIMELEHLKQTLEKSKASQKHTTSTKNQKTIHQDKNVKRTKKN